MFIWIFLIGDVAVLSAQSYDRGLEKNERDLRREKL